MPGLGPAVGGGLVAVDTGAGGLSVDGETGTLLVAGLEMEIPAGGVYPLTELTATLLSTT